MNNQLKARWVEALRSGDYVQGSGMLRYNTDMHTDKHCCLGVLCEVMGLEPIKDYSGVYAYGTLERSSSENLTPHIREMIGMTADEHREFIVMNDDLDYSFNEIADHIEKGME